MELYEGLISRRSIRRYKQNPISSEMLEKIINAARFAPSAGNRQPWEFVVVTERERVRKIHSCVRWLKASGEPGSKEKPVVYIVVLLNKKRAKGWAAMADCAAATQNILLAAHSFGLGSCWIGSVEREKVAELLNLPSYFYIFSIISLGYPEESPRIREEKEEKIIPQKDEKGNLWVPKRDLSQILHLQSYPEEGKDV